VAILTSTLASSRAHRVAGFLFLWLYVIGVAIAGVPEETDEYKLKAAFLYNFAKFVTWPSNSFEGPDSPFVICIVGEDPFGRGLDDAVAGRVLNGRPLRIERITEPAKAAVCQILFVGSSERKRVTAILAALPTVGILTVGENVGFSTSGGIINFTLNGGHLKFEINRRAAERAGLRISSRLLALGQIIDK
jgi:hypothetical protein